ncbi:GGDEF domain-containing protein [Pseudoalteromonas sp. SSDWG2]|uniref:GGDEF domain-containing protein n=1 Tax=Pseudoalteromonas sp. SSDWG2 TaxID=3139391 RepID=UPI003BAA6C56
MQQYIENETAESLFTRVEVLKFAVIIKVASFAALIHLLLIPIFYYIGAKELAFFNIFSALAWFYGVWLINYKSPRWGLRIFTFEVILHSIACCYYLGTEAGFQFYLWSISCILLVDYRMKMKSAMLYSGLLIITFALMYVYFADVHYLYKFYDYIQYIEVVNILIAGLPMIYTLALIRKIALEQRSTLAQMATRDYLTNLYNRRFAKELIYRAQQRCFAQGENVCIAIGDVDHFKQINDKYGHEIGDAVLKELSSLLLHNTRPADIVARWGGEEFIIVLPGISLSQAHKRIEKIRDQVKQLRITQSPLPMTISASFGITQWQSQDTLTSALARADAALYLSKNNGRDQTTVKTTNLIPSSAK